jgi:hypothetical protein
MSYRAGRRDEREQNQRHDKTPEMKITVFAGLGTYAFFHLFGMTNNRPRSIRHDVEQVTFLAERGRLVRGELAGVTDSWRKQH